ncbi:MAG TPA: hypothetical protein VGE77_04685 [Nocardioides sp.]
MTIPDDAATEVPTGTSAPELRGLVLDLIDEGRRRTFPAMLHVGRAGLRHSVAAGDYDDHAVRSDVVTVLLERAPENPLVWLTRPGESEPEATDHAWSRAVRAAAAELGRTAPFVVVTRHGWSEPASGRRQTWRRLRDRRTA